MEIVIDMKDFEEKGKRLEKKRPAIFDNAMKSWLWDSAWKVKEHSVKGASRKAKWLGSYMNSFNIGGVKGGKGNRWIAIFNSQPYSGVIEYGGIWKSKMPPPNVFYKWIKMKLGVDPDRVESVAFAIARSYVMQGKAGKKAHKRKLIMTLALLKSRKYMQDRFAHYIGKGLGKL